MSDGRKPDLAAAQRAFGRFCATVAALRDPKDGCPWDLEQDHRTLRRYMIEEAYEAADAMAAGDPVHLREELGDVLLQVVLNAQVALDGGTFSIVDVIDGIDAKMRRRHPHVFAAAGDKPTLSSAEVHQSWGAIKAGEKAAAPAKAAGHFAGVDQQHPASLQALAIGKLAAKVSFDWDTADEVFLQVRSEVDEVAAELADPSLPKAKLADEIGDVFFSLVQLCRHLELDPELVAVDANRKFLRRFAALEGLATTQGVDVKTASREQLEALWRAVKQNEKANQRA